VKKLAWLLTVLLVGCTSVEEKSQEENPIVYNVAIVNTNNVNGNIEEGVGYSRLATIIKNEEQKFGSNNVFYLDGGGNFSGSEFADSSRGENVVKILNAINLQATTLGKGDFVYGTERIKELEKISNFRIVASNVKYRTGGDFVRPYVLRNIGGEKVAIIGIVSPALYDEMDEKTKAQIKIEEPILVIPQLLELIRKNNINFVIALTSMDDSNLNREWNISDVVKNIPGMDIVISSGEGNGSPIKKVGNTYIVREDKNFQSVGVTKIDMYANDSNPQKMIYEKIEAKDLKALTKVEKPIKIEKVEEVVSKEVLHRTVPGDTLYSLAKYYGVTVDDIKNLNPSIVGNNIKVGETYKISEKKTKIVEKKVEAPTEIKTEEKIIGEADGKTEIYIEEKENQLSKEEVEDFDSIAVEMNDMESIPQDAVEIGKNDIPTNPAMEDLIKTLK